MEQKVGRTKPTGLRKRVWNLSRTRVISILEDYGFACYDSESTEKLKRALLANVEDGTIPRSALSR